MPVATMLYLEGGAPYQEERLMRGVHGAERQPGEIRRSQHWMGGSRPGNAAYVPAPPHALAEVLSAFEKSPHGEDSLPPLVRAGPLHGAG